MRHDTPLQDALTLQGQQGQGARGSFRTFEDARVYVRTLGLKSVKEWQAWRKSGARPHDIPSAPDTTYKSSGWKSWGDFLGYDVGQHALSASGTSASASASVHYSYRDTKRPTEEGSLQQGKGKINGYCAVREE